MRIPPFWAFETLEVKDHFKKWSPGIVDFTSLLKDWIKNWSFPKAYDYLIYVMVRRLGPQKFWLWNEHSISFVQISSPGISEAANLGAHKEARIRSPPAVPAHRF